MVAATAVLLAPRRPTAGRFLALRRHDPSSDRMASTIVIPVGGAASGFSPQNVSLERGGLLTVVNDDNVTHTVTSEAVGTQGRPALRPDRPGPRHQDPGAPSGPGRREYPFYCTFHPHMRGTLVMTGEPGGDVPGRRSSSRRCASRRR